MLSKFRILGIEGQGCGGSMVVNSRCELSLYRVIRRDGLDRYRYRDSDIGMGHRHRCRYRFRLI